MLPSLSLRHRKENLYQSLAGDSDTIKFENTHRTSLVYIEQQPRQALRLLPIQNFLLGAWHYFRARIFRVIIESTSLNTHKSIIILTTYPPPCIQNTTGILAFGLTSPETKTLLETKNKAAETHITDTEIQNDQL